jgi:hypothetical protein
MARFVHIPFGEIGKNCGYYVLNLDLIKHVLFVSRNEAIPNSEAYATVHYGDGKQTHTLNAEQANILLIAMGLR